MVNEGNVIIFLASSLTIDEAKKILPNARYLPPIQCGDILTVLRLKPRVIAIIDGLFESTAAVWHKEILFALEKGVQVYGAASMGALRAAELTQFGMIGVGKIFEAYNNRELIDDDEVAILHGPETSNYCALTTAMVNIRATLSLARNNTILDQQGEAQLLEQAKKLPYQQRNFTNIINSLLKKIKNSHQIQKFQQWLESGNYVNQKQLDAIALLKRINHLKECTPNRTKKGAVHRSSFLRVLHKDMMCQPFPSHHDWLPEDEIIALKLKKIPAIYPLIKRLAYLLSAINSIASKNSTIGNSSLAQRIEKAELLSKAVQKSSLSQQSVEHYLFSLMRISGAYSKFKTIASYRQSEPWAYQINYQTAKYWRIVDSLFQQKGLKSSGNQIEKSIHQFRHKRRLITESALNSWLTENGCEHSDFVALINAASLFNSIIMNNCIDILDVTRCDEEVWWFMDALILTGIYDALKTMDNSCC